MEDRRLLATIDLAALTLAQGSVIFGADAGDGSGRTMLSYSRTSKLQELLHR